MTKYRIPSEHDIERRWPCSVCGDDTRPRDQMVAKRVQFTTLGAGFKTLKSRTVEYLCPTCREADEVWLSPPYSGPTIKEREVGAPTEEED